MAKIVVVEDDNNFFAAEEAFLKKMGHDVMRATTPDEFLAAATNQKQDLVVMDMQFPGGGAPAAADLIKSNAAITGLPFIFCSAMPIEQVQTWFPDHPKRRYLRKPPDYALFKKYVLALLPAADATQAPTTASAGEPTALARQFSEEFKKSDVQKNAVETAAKLAELILQEAVRARASDVHLDHDRNSVYIRYRIDGALRDQAVYPKALFPIIPRLRIMANLSPTPPQSGCTEEGSFDLATSVPPVRARFSSFPCAHGEKIVMRLLDSSQGALSLDVLGFQSDVLAKLKSLIEQPSGLFFTVGMTGCGKTTTLSSILQHLNRPDLNIMTLEDPVEYQLPRVNHAQISAKFDFADGLRGLLRQDPDVIMLGEVRDSETAELALRAATTGHKIFSTIHATNSGGVIARLLGMGIEPFIISSGLLGTVAQRLVKRVCSKCALPAAPAPDMIARILGALDPQEVESVKAILQSPGGNFRAAKGCATCASSGYFGRAGVYELMPIDAPIRDLILKKADTDDIYSHARKAGMRTLVMDVMMKARAGWTTLEQAYRMISF